MIQQVEVKKVYNRLGAIMAHTNRYAFDPASRLAKDTGLSYSTIDHIPFDKTMVQDRFMQDLKRFALFSSGILNNESTVPPTIGPQVYQSYARFVLTQGNHDERKSILGTFQHRLILKDKMVMLETIDSVTSHS